MLDSNDFARKIDSVGTPIPFIEMRIVGDDGRELPTGEVGEIVGRSPLMMPGYYKRPDLTAQAIKRRWLFTGDVGMAGRRRISASRRPEEGPDHLRRRERLPEGHRGSRGAASRVSARSRCSACRATSGASRRWRRWCCKRPVTITGAELQARGSMQRVAARYQQLSEVVIVDDLPRSTAGKTLKRVLARAIRFARRIGALTHHSTGSRIMSTTVARPSCDGSWNVARALASWICFYLDAAGDSPLVLLHGLSANASSFTALDSRGARTDVSHHRAGPARPRAQRQAGVWLHDGRSCGRRHRSHGPSRDRARRYCAAIRSADTSRSISRRISRIASRA